MSENERSTFLQQLFDKKAYVIGIGQKTGKDVNGALREVDRQIQQALRGNPITGEGVTKSGKED